MADHLGLDPGVSGTIQQQRSSDETPEEPAMIDGTVCEPTVQHESSPAEHVASTSFQVDNAAIAAVPRDEQAEELQALGLSVYNQTTFEEGILQQVDRAFQQQENERQKQMSERALTSVVTDIRSVKTRLNQIEKALAMLKTAALTNKDAKRKLLSIQKDKENKEKQLKTLRAKQRKLMGHINGDVNDANTDVESSDEVLGEETKFEIEQVLGLHKPKESIQEKLIRTGQMTPFGTLIRANGAAKDQTRPSIKLSDSLTDFEKYLLDQGQLQEKKKQINPAKPQALKKEAEPTTKTSKTKKKHKSESLTDGDVEMISLPSTSRDFPPLVPKPKKKHRKKLQVGSLIAGKDDKKVRRPKWGEWPDKDANVVDLEAFEHPASGSEYAPSDEEDSDERRESKIRSVIERNKTSKGVKRKKGADSDSEYSESGSKRPKKSVKRKLVDDGNLADYTKRINTWKKNEIIRKQLLLEASRHEDEDPTSDNEEDGFEEFDGGYKVPLQIWNKLYRYQQTCVRWLWELHCQRCGGIVGDEMGLGKTIQIIAYLAGLSSTEIVSKNGLWRGLGPTIIVTPTTVMHQWVKECHTWWPQFRVAVLHESGSYSGTKESLVRNINKVNGILVTSYSGIVIHQENLLRYDWHYIILDEGHKIRNPDARATLVCKQFRTSHRIILSGSPMQNNLKELWSLFDFCFPGKLGTLPVFLQQFAVPITHGGYSNATQVQVQTAYKCAVVLRDSITPYLLRRMKADVKMNLNLPEKNEQVLFCRLTQEQRDCYKEYLESRDVKSILDGRLKVFVGLIMLRKICNHPDLCTGGPKIFGKVDESTLSEDMHYGYWKRSGKMLVIESILRLWHKQGHRVLLFSQSKQMLDILERFVKIQGYSSLRMDGGTGIGSRQPMVARFNDDPSIFVFLLTTRVGGLGVNLTGANRVVIFDPDWNPSTDMQARERAWRIGQNRDVTIYRLVTSGTIEEKIYHRQIFKQFLTNRVLKDPRQRRFFKSNDMFELFVLKDDASAETETSAIFAGTGSDIRVPTPNKKGNEKRSRHANKSGDDEDNGNGTSCLSKEKIQKMKELARRLSKQIGREASGGSGAADETANVSKNPESSSVDPAAAKDELLSQSVRPKEKHLKRKKKERLKKTNFEGIYVKHLVGQSKSDGKSQDEDKKTAKQDEYVLQSLFAKTGVHAAMKHDSIMESSNPDYMLVEGEAERVAKEAVKVLRLSRKMCARAEVGLPTWTGANGLSGVRGGVKSTAKPRFGQKKNSTLLADVDRVKLPVEEVSGSGKILEALLQKSKKVFSGESDSTNGKVPSSSLLLAQMKQRNHLNPEVAGSDDDDDASSSGAGPSGSSVVTPLIPENRLTTDYDELLVDIRNFVAFQSTVNGEASTNEILDKFQHKVPPKDSAVFKALINKICDFTRNVQGDGIWQLKVEFR